MPHMNLCQLHHYHGVDPNRCFVCEEQKLRNENTMLRGQLEKDQALVTRLCVDNERLRETQQCGALEGTETGAPCGTYRMLEAQKDDEIERLRQKIEKLEEQVLLYRGASRNPDDIKLLEKLRSAVSLALHRLESPTPRAVIRDDLHATLSQNYKI